MISGINQRNPDRDPGIKQNGVKMVMKYAMGDKDANCRGNVKEDINHLHSLYGVILSGNAKARRSRAFAYCAMQRKQDQRLEY
jgi:hypothetical protein